MTAQQAFDARVEEKIRSLRPYLVKVARNDEDLVQEGAIGVWEAMQRQPDAPDPYLKKQAKWNIHTVARGIGKSLDIPKWHERKTPISLIRIGHLCKGRARTFTTCPAKHRRANCASWQ